MIIKQRLTPQRRQPYKRMLISNGRNAHQNHIDMWYCLQLMWIPRKSLFCLRKIKLMYYVINNFCFWWNALWQCFFGNGIWFFMETFSSRSSSFHNFWKQVVFHINKLWLLTINILFFYIDIIYIFMNSTFTS